MSNVLHPTFGTGSKIPPRDHRDWVTSHELCADAGVTWRMLDYWTRTGLLAAIDAPRGHGRLRRYAPEQANRARTIRDLLDAGVSLQTCRQVLDELLATGHVDLGPIHLTYQPKEAS